MIPEDYDVLIRKKKNFKELMSVIYRALCVVIEQLGTGQLDRKIIEKSFRTQFVCTRSEVRPDADYPALFRFKQVN